MTTTTSSSDLHTHARGLGAEREAEIVAARADRHRSARLRPAYGFDDVAIVPGTEAIHPDDVNTTFQLGEHRFAIPFIASAMDGVVDVPFAIKIGQMGGLGVLNLDGLQTRYEDPSQPLADIAAAEPGQVTALMQKLYQAPVREDLVGRRIAEIKRAGVKAAVSCTPTTAGRFGPLADAAGVDLFVVQATVSTRRFRSSRIAEGGSGYSGTGGHTALDFEQFCRAMRAPVVVGNCVTYEAALELMDAGIAGLLVGVGPGAACTSREVLGIGVPQVTATLDCSAARDAHYARSGRYVPIITDGGMKTGGDVCKAFASGADAVMIGSPFAQAEEAPGRGHHWGMATPHAGLPRGTRIKVGVNGSLQTILFGPTSKSDGTQNFVGALRTCMGTVGAGTIRDMHEVEMVIAPAMKTEGKSWQLSGAF
ncbi:MAG: GuaB3 family IMP dehydrogenase-related protein [Chloroflexi bacterium]|nr:GuaB3 family IMP dehydrogenase-related protein [Chloroflexota bacterium]